MFRKPSIILIILFLPCFLLAQSTIGLREIINYEKLHYNAGAQNWDIRQDVQGRVYFANNEGLLCFDGIYWNLYPLPNKTIVRSIEFGDDNRIYIGAQDEIGFFAPGKNGKLSYTSLKGLLKPEDQKFADIWDIVRYGPDIFFRSNNKMFLYSHGRMTVFAPPVYWNFIGLNNRQLIAQEQSRGLLVFKNGEWVTLIAKDSLPPGFNISSIVSFGANTDSCLITTHKSGLFVLAADKLHSLKLSGMDINLYQDFSSAAKIDNENIIVGTYTNGFYVINRKGEIIENLSKREGLQNSNVRSIFSDRGHNIWLGLESGIDFIAFNNAIKHINPPVMNDGAGFATAIYNNRLYFGLSNGIYEMPLPDIKDMSYGKNDLAVISEGQTWGLSLVDNMLLAGTDEGFFQVKEKAVVPVVKGTGFWTFQPLQAIINQPPLIVAGNYRGIKLFEKRNNSFFELAGISEFTESTRYIAIDDSKDIIWVSHPYRGVYRIEFNMWRSPHIKLYGSVQGLPSSLKNHVYKIRNRIVIATEKGIYEYNSSSDTFEPSVYFREIFGDNSVRYLKEDPDGNIWFIQEKNIGVVDFSTLKPTVIYLPELKGKILSGFENVYPVNGNNIFVGAEKGFYHINFEKYKLGNHPLSVYIRSVKAMGKIDSVLFGGYFGNVNENNLQTKATTPSVDHKWNSFHIEYSSPFYEQQSNVEYSYFLEGFDKDWSDWSKKAEKDYTNLSAGTYTFRLKARNNLGNESGATSYSFVVLPPWYQATWAYIIYAAALIYLAYILYKRHEKKLFSERQKHQEEQKRVAYLHQLELEKSEKEVVKLRNEKLETEIEFKNTQLASTAMHLVHKEEFLSKIKDELQHLNKNGKESADPAELKKILRVLSEEEKLNEEWEQFSVHFNKVHSNFLITLKEKYPSLKAHELKLCAYLRMNLSSKEIAQLMSISIRGVEISRYRVRKKLQIPTEMNLFQFLFDLQRNNLNSNTENTN